MPDYDWSSFTKSINIKASPPVIYNAFASREGMESWFLRMCEYKDASGNLPDRDAPVEAGCMYRWRWHGWADEVEENGTILQANGSDLFEFTFNGNGATNMIVTVTIEQEDAASETIVSLKQYNIPIDEKSRAQWHIGCLEGWTFYLANLKSILEGGIDLRNKNPKNLKHKVINS